MRRREKGWSFRGRHHGVGATDVTLSGPVSPAVPTSGIPSARETPCASDTRPCVSPRGR